MRVSEIITDSVINGRNNLTQSERDTLDAQAAVTAQQDALKRKRGDAARAAATMKHDKTQIRKI